MSAQPRPCPALYLHPLHNTFSEPKSILLYEGKRRKVGRTVSGRSAPTSDNGFFDSRVLSRRHSEIWEQFGKIFIMDVGSSNGTYINGLRISPEGVTSKSFELQNGDVLEFGIDIVNAGDATPMHRKVIARVGCILTEKDARVAAEAEINQESVVSKLLEYQQSRRPKMQQPTLDPSSLATTQAFQGIMSRLQVELQKSRETAVQLRSLSSAMKEIHESLGNNGFSSQPAAQPTYRVAFPSA